jgi:ABC-2 type transport system ATP-binding protein
MQLLDIKNVSRSFGPIVALRDVSLSLEAGTIGLVGNNGAGKSTLLKILLGLLAPDGGGGTILGCDITQASRDLRGRIGYMPEAAALVPVLKGVEYVALAGDLYGMSHRDAKRRAHEVLNYVGLGELRYRQLEEYSAGNVQRLKLAAALVHDPQLLLLDEPTNGLDPAGRVSMLRLIDDLIAETGKSMILCTHLLGDIERLCEQVVVIDRGRVVRSGTMADLRQIASNRYELAWQETNGCGHFRAALAASGVEVLNDMAECESLVSVPAGWSTSRFFQIARECRVILTTVKLEEEDLSRVFFRVTDESALVAAAEPDGETAESPAPLGSEAAHGN